MHGACTSLYFLPSYPNLKRKISYSYFYQKNYKQQLSLLA